MFSKTLQNILLGTDTTNKYVQLYVIIMYFYFVWKIYGIPITHVLKRVTTLKNSVYNSQYVQTYTIGFVHVRNQINIQCIY